MDEASRLSGNEDLIYTDFEGSSHINSVTSDLGLVDELGTLGNESSNDSDILIDFNDTDVQDADTSQLAASPTNQSLVSNVFLQEQILDQPDQFAIIIDVGNSTENEPTQPLEHISSTSEPKPPYPAHRALRRRQQRIQLALKRRHEQHRRRRTERPIKSAPSVRSQVAGAAISLEEVAGRTEDTYFALSLVGSLERLTAKKRAIAKLHILQYLTELAFAEE